MIDLVVRHKRVVLFAFVGVINTCFDFIIFWALVQFAKLDLLLSNGIAFCCAVFLSYVLNRNITFADRRLNRKSNVANLVSYFCVAILALSGSSYTLLIIYDHIGLIEGKIAGTMVSFGINYIGIKTLVFKNTK
ncbi:MAG: GtrA family protein [Desulfobacterales bacterium]|nr:GtrA family protein [Desulfobacterales bacterium]